MRINIMLLFSAQLLVIISLKAVECEEITTEDDVYYDLSNAKALTSAIYDYRRPPRLAIDKHFGSNGYMDCTVAKAAEGSNKVWIQIDMGKPYDVQAVEILPRSDGFPSQMADFQVSVGNSVDYSQSQLCVKYDGNLPNDGALRRLYCKQTLNGRYITLQKTAGYGQSRYITLCKINILSPKVLKHKVEGEDSEGIIGVKKENGIMSPAKLPTRVKVVENSKELMNTEPIRGSLVYVSDSGILFIMLDDEWKKLAVDENFEILPKANKMMGA